MMYKVRITRSLEYEEMKCLLAIVEGRITWDVSSHFSTFAVFAMRDVLLLRMRTSGISKVERVITIIRNNCNCSSVYRYVLWNLLDSIIMLSRRIELSAICQRETVLLIKRIFKIKSTYRNKQIRNFRWLNHSLIKCRWIIPQMHKSFEVAYESWNALFRHSQSDISRRDLDGRLASRGTRYAIHRTA